MNYKMKNRTRTKKWSKRCDGTQSWNFPKNLRMFIRDKKNNRDIRDIKYI